MLGNGEFLRREAYGQELVRKARAKRTAEAAKLRAMTPAQRAAYKAKQAATVAAMRASLARANAIRSPKHTGPLSADEEKIRKLVINRDWDALFSWIPPKQWGRQTGLTHGSPAKYSFWWAGGKKGGARHYKPFTSADYLKWTMSKWYSVQPGHVCSDEQRRQGVAYYMSGQNKWKAANRHTHPNHVFPFYPGGGARDQSYGCQRDKDSWWVKNRKKVVAAVAVVAAVYLGPIVLSKIGAGAAEGAAGAGAAGTGAGAGTTGIVGAGAKTGALATKVLVKEGVGAAITAKSVGAATAIKGATTATNWVAKVKKGVDVYNKANQINAVIHGELPPPPISLTGNTFTEIAMNYAKQEIKEEISERAGEYVSKKMQEKMLEKMRKEEEAMLRAEIEAMQRELAKFAPPGTPIEVSPLFDPPIRAKLTEMQNIELQRQQQNAMLFAVGAGGAMLLLG